MSPDSTHQVRLLLLDKLLLALVLAVAGYLLNSQLQHTRTTTEYQRLLFDSRRAAYDQLLISARQARDLAAELYQPTDTVMTDVSEELIWKTRRRSALAQRAMVEDPARSPGSPDFPQGPLFATLDSLEQRRKDAALYISSPVDSAVDRFMETLWVDLAQLRHVTVMYGGGIGVQRPVVPRGATDRAFAAFAELRAAIRRSLRIDEIILG